MHVDLAVQSMRQEADIPFFGHRNQCDACFIAGGLHPQDEAVRNVQMSNSGHVASVVAGAVVA